MVIAVGVLLWRECDVQVQRQVYLGGVHACIFGFIVEYGTYASFVPVVFPSHSISKELSPGVGKSSVILCIQACHSGQVCAASSESVA